MPSTETQNRPLTPEGQTPLAVVLPFRAKETGTAWLFWRGLLYGEWHAHSRLILFFLGAWLVTVWFVPRLSNPGWILAFGSVYAFIAGPAMGGRDVLEGCEEFVFSMPATRSDWFLARWLFGAGLLLAFTLLDLLALGLDVSQAMTRFYLDTGLMEYKGVPQPGMLYGLILAFPLAVYSISFALASNARSRGLIASSTLWAGLAGLAVLRLGFLYEFWRWHAWTGYFAGPALVAAALLAFIFGWRRFCAKEVVQPAKPWNMPPYWWAWALLILGSLALTAFLLHSLGAEFAQILGR
jgi:hypothetical protein